MAGPLDILGATTIANYAKGAWDGISHNYPFLGKVKELADWEYDVGGTTVTGPLEAGRHQAALSSPGMDLSDLLVVKNRYATWTFPWGEMVGALRIDKGALRRNTGNQALVNIRDKEIPALIRDTLYGQYGFAWQILNQNLTTPTGPGATTGLPIAGLPTFLFDPATAVALEGLVVSTGLSTGLAMAVSDQEVCAPAATLYGGLSLAPNGVVVDGTINDAWRPTLVNTGFAWNGTANKDIASINLWLEWAVQRARRFSSKDVAKRPNMGLMDFVYYQALGAFLATKQQIWIDGGKKTGDNVANLGYQDGGLPHAGFMFDWDESMPASTVYILNAKQAQVKIQPLYDGILGASPLTVTGEDAGIIEMALQPDPLRRQYLCTATIPGQMMFSPRYQVRCSPYKTS